METWQIATAILIGLFGIVGVVLYVLTMLVRVIFPDRTADDYYDAWENYSDAND